MFSGLRAGCAESPNAVWVTQQARQLCWELAGRAVPMRFLIHYNDSTFTAGFDAVLSAGHRGHSHAIPRAERQRVR
jgi:hypothetical protein